MRVMPGSTTSDFDYTLPEGRIARYPLEQRDGSRLLCMDRASGDLTHRTFSDLPSLMQSGDVLVVNDSRVRPARLIGHKPTGAQAEILLLRPIPPEGSSSDERDAGPHDTERWEALVRPGARLKPGAVVNIADDLTVRILDSTATGGRVVELESPGLVSEARERYGVVPLPPYIDRVPDGRDRERYQTVYANQEGSVAAPTAGLHFTNKLLQKIEATGVKIVRVRLDVGVGTFRPVEEEDPSDHPMHSEWFEVTDSAAATVNEAHASGRHVWAVGTTVVRSLEAASLETGNVRASEGWTDLFVRPGFEFQTVDRLITNFHLPRSTLLMLVAAFAGYENTMAAYAEAVEHDYRFYSYGDAMVVR